MRQDKGCTCRTRPGCHSSKKETRQLQAPRVFITSALSLLFASQAQPERHRSYAQGCTEAHDRHAQSGSTTMPTPYAQPRPAMPYLSHTQPPALRRCSSIHIEWRRPLSPDGALMGESTPWAKSQRTQGCVVWFQLHKQELNARAHMQVPHLKVATVLASYTCGRLGWVPICNKLSS